MQSAADLLASNLARQVGTYRRIGIRRRRHAQQYSAVLTAQVSLRQSY
jgi:hypothetical protein